MQHISTTHEIYLKCEVNLPLENALSKLRPQTEANMDVFRDVERLIHEVSFAVHRPRARLRRPGQVVVFLADPIGGLEK